MSDKEVSQFVGDTAELVENSNTNTSVNATEDTQSENSENEIENESFVSKEEDNCLRYFLGIGIAEKAVRIWFDTVIPPDKLENHLQSHERKLRKICNDDQISKLFPGNSSVISSTFDISLMYKIIRNTTKVRKPIKDWGETPDDTDVEPADDLERVRIQRNSLCHGPQSISDNEFEKKWKELKEIIQRLAGGQLLGDVESLQSKDLDHSSRASVKSLLAVLTARVQNVEKYAVDHIPKNIREQHEREIRKWREMDRLFWTTAAYQKVLDKIRSSPFVTVTGSGGRGKTFLIRHIALELAQDGFEIIPVSTLEQVILYGQLNFKQLFIVDDVLGVYGLDMSLYNSLSRQSDNVLDLLETGSKLLMSCRSVVFNESKLLNSFVTDDNHVINLDDKSNELNDEDVKNMLQNHCKYKNVREVCFEKLKLPSILPMFPLLCRVFSSTEKYQAMGDNFFLVPYQCMFSDLDNMQELNKVHYAGLVYCVIKDNCVRPKSFDRNCLKDVLECCRLSQSTSNSKLVHAMQVLKGSYLTQDAEGRYFFIHDNFFEIVAVHFGKRFPECLIKHYTSCSIYKLLTIENTISEIKDDMIPIFEDHFLALVDRILCDIKDFKFYEVFSRIGHFWKCEKFVSTVCGTLEKLNFGEIRQLLFDVQKCEHEDKRQPFTEKLEDQMNEMIDKRRELGIDKRYECKFQILHKYSPRVITWIIAYGYVNLLSRIIKIVESKSRFIGTTGSVNDDISKDISEVVFGTGLELQSVCFTLSCCSGSLEMVKLVFRHVKAECTNYILSERFTPLFVALSTTCNDIVEFLLSKGADVNVSFGKYNISILAYSCFFGNENAVDSLVKGGANINAPMANFGSALHFTSYFGNLHLVKYLIKNGADVNNYDKNGRSPLHYAIVGGNLEIVKCLIKSNANVNFCDIDVKSPLNYASYKGHLEIVNCLLNCGADVNCGASCLSAACSSGQYDVVELLIDKIDINRVDDFCDPPLHSAASSGHVDIVKNLIEHGADVNLLCSCGNPLYCATQNGHLHIIEYLMEHGANVNQGYCGDKNTSLLCCASSRGYLEIVKELVRYGADINVCDKDGRSPLCLAAREGHVGIVKYLINRAVNVNVCDLRGRSPLYYASARGYLHIIKCLIQNNADLQVVANSLSVACSNGHHDVVEYLIDKADVNRVEGISDPPMHSAASSGHLNIVEFLVKHGADVNLLTSVGNPLYCATKNSHLHVIEYLVKHGANINQGYCGDTNTSPLCCASSKGYLKIVKELVRLGADVNLYDEDGRSPLFHAVYGGHLEIVKYLINKVLSINICDRYGKSLLYYASAGGHLDVVQFLINSDADADYDISCLFVACHRGHYNIVEYLVDKVKNISSCDGSGRSPLYYASAEGQLDIVKCLIMNHADVNCGASCLSAASNRGHFDIVEYLSDKANVNEIQGYSDPPLHSAASSGHLDIVKYLVAHGADVNLLSFWNESPLYCATKKGQLHVIEYLVEHGADINQGRCDDINTSPLYCASSKGYLEIVKGLVKRGADVNICDLNGNSPLCYASRYGHLEIVKFLLQSNADFNIGVSCLSAACKSGHLDVVEYLSNIMDVNKVYDICDPALHSAAGQGHIDIVKYLVETGANVNLLSFHGYSPLCCAVENKHLRVVEYLVGHGAHIERAVHIALEGDQRHILDFLLKLLN